MKEKPFDSAASAKFVGAKLPAKNNISFVMANEANSILAEPTIVPATTTQDEVAEDFPHIRENQNVLIHMPSGNVKIVNLKRNT